MEDDDEYSASDPGMQNYYTLAHTVSEEVNEQASIMVNGQLKEYQVNTAYCSLTLLTPAKKKQLCTFFSIINFYQNIHQLKCYLFASRNKDWKLVQNK